MSKKPDKSIKCKWRHENWKYMENRGMDSRRIASLARNMASPGVTTLRQTHIIAIRIEESNGDVAIVNASQSIKFAKVAYNELPCLTPSCKLWLHAENRTLTATESMIAQGFPVHKIDVGASSEKELYKLAGNSMHIRCIFVAIVAAFGAVDRKKLEKFMVKLPP